MAKVEQGWRESRAGLLLRDGARIGLLGGSFDPAHAGHVFISEQALKRFGLDQVWWLVTPGNPLKQHGPAPLEQRLVWARKLVGHPRIRITALEAEFGTRATIDTIRALQRHWPKLRFCWLMGADNLVQFNRWEDWREIAARVPIGVLARPGSRLRARLSSAARYMRRNYLSERAAFGLGAAMPPAWAMVNIPMVSHSSSAIRGRLGQQDWTQAPLARIRDEAHDD
ncbi:MAG: nicotinate-nucleotide adenylyltransferase [Paracoccus sp. (in: a-proteobacteria)]|uniref:nicotinate-nucleotide adenylyltransferase n=1 Tax=Paracoccus sp. TaxID=267 RepID=UPI0026E0E9D1|nr:nicotinate-nucleotide adenylyltransferase [Paracoccus sp. (in: a-proteobacteria)]MDO5622060.1 nicotinate-nucleotide adenylyltransferase [Paracoccus sp. (in: a-proteobacteria)]